MVRFFALLCVVMLAGCRPAGEVVRYMARPPASIRPVPADGVYLLYPGTDDPAVLVEDLKAGEPIGFTFVDSPAGRKLYAVAGDDRSFLLDRGERYAWMQQAKMKKSQTDSADLSTAGAQRQRAAERGLKAAQEQFDAAEKNLAAAKRRVEESKKSR